MVRPMVHSTKHYVQQSLETVVGGTLTTLRLANALDVRSGDPDNVLAGSTVKAVFVEMWIRSTEVTPGTVLVSLIKTPDSSNITFADVTALHDYANKKNVFYHTQGLTNDSDANAIAFVRGWFKIPKGKQRFGLGDRLFLAIASQAPIDNVMCGFATYKEYS